MSAMPDREFEGRVALVTGGSRGIGRAICARLARAGAAVAVGYADNADAARETLDAVKAAGGRGVLVRGDVADADDVARMNAETEGALGPVDLLVANAGIAIGGGHDALRLEDWRRTMAVNVDGVLHAVMAVKDGMIRRGFGRIVCMASIAGLFARPRLVSYAVSKAAVIALTRNIAPGLAPAVRINAVAPGLTDTDMIADIPEERRAAMIADTPLERLGKPEEIAELAAFLLSERSAFTTGQTVVADGGRVMLP